MTVFSSLSSRPTLLVFTLGASGEAERRPLLPAGLLPAELELRRACLASVLAGGRARCCRLRVASPRPLAVDRDVEQIGQHGDGFAERLGNAVAESEGGGPLVVVGTDVPGLTPSHVEGALARLAEEPKQVVIGPSPDGGVYLLAAVGPLATLLRNVRWCRRDTLSSLCRVLRQAGRPYSLLAPLEDLDRPADLERWLARRPRATAVSWRELRRRLIRLLAANRRPTTETGWIPWDSPCFAVPSGRSPPLRLALG